MTSVSSSSSSRGEHAVPRPIACLNCRQRRSYCSKDRPACSRCRTTGLACTYEEARKVPINESRLRGLEAKADAYDALMNQSDNQGRMRNSADNSDDDFEDDPPLLEPFTQLSLVKPSSSFKGPGSSDTFLRNLRKLSGLYGDDTTLDAQSNFYEPDAIPSRRTSSRIRVRLPPPDIARRLFAAQYTYIGTIFAFTNPTDSFEQLLAEAYRGPPDLCDREACLRYAKVLVVLAFGQLYSVNQWVDFRGPPGFDYFVDALNLLPDPHEEGSILFVETLALVGYFFQNMNRPSVSSMYTGMALRMAISLGLHQELSSLGPSCQPFQTPLEANDIYSAGATILDDASREHRRRVWWSVYSLDRILSIKSGNPITIQDEEIGVQLPSQLPGEIDCWSVTVFRHYTQLSRVLGEIHAAIYRKSSQRKSGKRLMQSVQGIIMTLSRWNRELPDELRFDPAKLSISRESVSTFSHYYQCINMTVRPLLSHIVQRRLERMRSSAHTEGKERDWKVDLSLSTIKVIEVCIDGAQDVISMMTIAAERDLVATYGYMDGEHVVSATIVLVMVCVAFPVTADNIAAMHAGLRLLRDMGERGNSHMAARYNLLSSVVQAEGVGGISSSMEPARSAAGMEVDGSDTNSPIMLQRRPDVAFGTTHRVDGQQQQQQQGAGAQPSSSQQHGMINIGGPRVIPNFPALDNNTLGEPFFDENMTTGMDFTLWEEGFAHPTMDAGLGFSQWSEAVSRALRTSNGGFQQAG